MRISIRVLVAVACTLGACGDSHDDETGPVVSPTSVTIVTGRSATLTATAGDSIANLMWSSSDPSVATVTAGAGFATVTGVARGHATIDAQLGAGHTSVDVVVVSAVVDRIDVTAARTVIPLGDTQQLAARGHKTDDHSDDLSQTAAWTSQDPAIASVDRHGLVTVHAVGQTAITASQDGATGSIAITVGPSELRGVAVTPDKHTLAKGLTVPLVVNGTFSDGSVLDLTTMATWQTSNATVATVSTAGVVQSLALGSAMITAAVNGLTASAEIKVGPPVLTTIAITPDPLVLLVGADQPLSVTGTWSDGQTRDVTASATWTVAGAALTLDAAGSVHAVEEGHVTITADVDGVTATLFATVHRPIRLEVAPVFFVPPPVVLAQQQRVAFRAWVVFADLSTEDVTATATWSSSDPAIASVTAGRVESQTQSGVTTVTVEALGFSVPVEVEVTTESCHPVINEVLSEGSSPNDEWVELYNPCTQTIDVSGWTLVCHGSFRFEIDRLMVTLDGSMAPGAFRLYAGAGYTGTGAAAPDGGWAGASGMLETRSFSIGLLRSGSGTPIRVSGVAFGDVAENPFGEGANAPGLLGGAAGARFPFDGSDTHDGHRDFRTLIPTPKASNFGR